MRLNSYKSHHQQSAGFALVAAIFLIVVVGLLIVYLQRLSSNQANVNAQAAQNARALQAAQSGLEWGVYTLFQANVANPATVPAVCRNTINPTAVLPIPLTPENDPRLALGLISGEVRVAVGCVLQNYTETGVTVRLFTLTATAQQGADLNSPDYAFKRVTATIEI